MAFTIKQGHPFPQNLLPGGTASFTIDVGSDVPISGQAEWIAVTFPEGLAFPQPGGEVRYIAASGTVNNVLPATWDPNTKQLRFQHALHLNDGTPGQNGFYSINIQALSSAAPGERVQPNALSIAGVTAELRILIGTPPPLPPVEQRVYGLVNDLGVIQADSSSGDFQVKKQGPGVYDIIFDNPFISRVAVLATIYSHGSLLDNVQARDILPHYVRIYTGDQTGNLADRHFSFLVIGGAPPRR
ncbi:hypothetical protein [Kitasatospora sp. MAP5-34]|uniref:hypothetical protein n=1 Tax=Kitasatospora sp. MAP5-34 TaxID=3035102 RepID=UPI002473DE0D|nr:hypothetical protein [Kitasatospora sp. MAP5-34]MDH6574468.1 hypothetical protein [Kitasatospora sp. MAP5-34]